MANRMKPKRMATAFIILAAALLPAGAQAGGWGEDYFKQTDANNDGALTKEEMSAARATRLGAADIDKDGFVSAAELTEHHAAMMRARQDKRFKYFSDRFDANKDGKVALDEVKAYDPPFFAKADANGDGKLSEDEMKAMGEKHPGGMGGMGGMHDGKMGK